MSKRGRIGISDMEMEREIALLLKDPDVKAGYREANRRSAETRKRRQKLYHLRSMKKLGASLRGKEVTGDGPISA